MIVNPAGRQVIRTDPASLPDMNDAGSPRDRGLSRV